MSRGRLSMDIKQNEIQQAYPAFQVGLGLMSIREAERRQSENPSGNTNNEETKNEQMDDNSSSGSENLPERLRRYLHISLDEPSDPDF